MIPMATITTPANSCPNQLSDRTKVSVCVLVTACIPACTAAATRAASAALIVPSAFSCATTPLMFWICPAIPAALAANTNPLLACPCCPVVRAQPSSIGCHAAVISAARCSLMMVVLLVSVPYEPSVPVLRIGLSASSSNDLLATMLPPGSIPL
ncbi:hypothetical protein GO285_05315 [Ralstonia solanacearum]|nr:hypothetical protein [Ralstonia solanacearum]NKG13481.1 hypothetical protein [Ralstonia solanacearum]